MPLYSGCGLKCLVTISPVAALAACSSVGSRTSHVAKLLRQKYWHGMPAFLNSSSKVSLFSPTSLLVFRSEMTSKRILGVTLSTISGMGSISFPLKYFAYLSTLSFLKSSGPLCWPFQGVGTFLGWLYRTVLAVFGVLRGSGDRQRRPICPYKALRCLVSSGGSRCPLHGCDKISSQEGKDKPPPDARMEGGSTVFSS